MKKLSALPVFALAALLATAACGGDANDEAAASGGDTPSGEAANSGDAVLGESGTVLTPADSTSTVDVGPSGTNAASPPAAGTNGAMGGPGSTGGPGSSQPNPPAPGTNSGTGGASTTQPATGTH